MTDFKASIIVSAIDRLSAPVQKMSKNYKKLTRLFKTRARDPITSQFVRTKFGNITKGFKDLGGGLEKVASSAKKSAVRLGVLGGSAAWLFKTQLVDTAAKFEQYRTILETVEGSSTKAKKSMDWVSDFATRTPFELDTVMESFVRLRAYGLDPTTGLLETLGDTGAAMGKPIMQAVEAIADAVTGENERLKEFGIKAFTKGQKVRYEYTDKDGKQRSKVVDKTNRKMIESTLTAIWNEKYGGAMQKQSKTWTGMMSNVADQWTRFTTMIMGAGLFDWMKDKLTALLNKINEMAASGELEKWAKNVGKEIKNILVTLFDFGKKAINVGSQLADFFSPIIEKIGPANAIIGVLAGFSFAPLITSLLSLIPLIWGLSAALLASPIGAFIAAIGALGALTAVTLAVVGDDSLEELEEDLKKKQELRKRFEEIAKGAPATGQKHWAEKIESAKDEEWEAIKKLEMKKRQLEQRDEDLKTRKRDRDLALISRSKLDKLGAPNKSYEANTSFFGPPVDKTKNFTFSQKGGQSSVKLQIESDRPVKVKEAKSKDLDLSFLIKQLGNSTVGK